MDNRTNNVLFLRAVANKYSISFEELERSVFDEFIQEDPDPEGVCLHSTQHFDRFVKKHKIKEVNVGTAVLYLKGVKLAISHQELEDESAWQNLKSNFCKPCFVCNKHGVIRPFIRFEKLILSIKWPALR